MPEYYQLLPWRASTQEAYQMLDTYEVHELDTHAVQMLDTHEVHELDTHAMQMLDTHEVHLQLKTIKTVLLLMSDT